MPELRFTSRSGSLYDRGRVVLSILYAPLRSFAERRVRTVRAECLDWTLVLGRRHLERVLRAYVEHYNGARPLKGAFIPIGGVTSGLPSRLVSPARNPRTSSEDLATPGGFRDTSPQPGGC